MRLSDKQWRWEGSTAWRNQETLQTLWIYSFWQPWDIQVCRTLADKSQGQWSRVLSRIFKYLNTLIGQQITWLILRRWRSQWHSSSPEAPLLYLKLHHPLRELHQQDLWGDSEGPLQHQAWLQQWSAGTGGPAGASHTPPLVTHQS